MSCLFPQPPHPPRIAVNLSSPRVRPLAALALGLAVGAGAAAVLTPRSSPIETGAPSGRADAAQTSTPAPGTDLPTIQPLGRLTIADADAVLAAYVALPALPDKAPRAQIAERTARLRALLTLLPDATFEKLFATLATRVGGAEAQLRRIAFDVWTERDAPAAARWAATIVPGEAINEPARDRYLHLAVGAWSDLDFDAAYAWSATQAPETAKGLAREMLRRLASRDPARALTLARSLGEEGYAAAREGIFRAWSEKNPVAAVQALGHEMIERGRMDWQLSQAWIKWLKSDGDAAFAWILAAPKDDERQGMSLLNQVTWQVGNDPEVARSFAARLLAHPDLPGQSGSLRQLMQSWSREKPADAIAWIKGLENAEHRSDLAGSLLDNGSLKADDYLAAVRLLGSAELREQRLAGYVEQWAGRDPDAALAWLGKQSGPDFTRAAERAQRAVIGQLARTDPAAAVARWQTLPAGEDRQALLNSIATGWSRTDPAAAARWFTTQTTESPRYQHDWQTIGTIARNYTAADPEGFLLWASSLPNQNQRLIALNSLANDHFFTNDDGPPLANPLSPARRAELLATIEDPKIRDTVLPNVLGNWLRRDYATAREWIETHDVLSDEAAAKLLVAHDPDA